jgi:hypothetical protein
MARLFITCQNKRVVYDLLMKAAAETTLEIAADPKRLARGSGLRLCCTRRAAQLSRPSQNACCQRFRA